MNNICADKPETSEAENKHDDADALFILGIRYSTGRDVEQDQVAAHKWFNLAAMMGHEGALSARAELAREMSAAQIAEAQREARAWLWSRKTPSQPAPAASEEPAKTAVVRPIYVRRRAQEMRSAKSFARAVCV
jgi:hypothetical protein